MYDVDRKTAAVVSMMYRKTAVVSMMWNVDRKTAAVVSMMWIERLRLCL